MKPHTLQHLSLKNLKSVCSTFLLAAAIISLVACSDNGSSSSSSGSNSSGGGSISVSGGGVKGPLAGAVVTAFAIDFSAADFKGSAVGSGSTNSQAQIQNLALPFPLNPPYLIEITADADTIDITTGMTPVISTMRTVITQAMLDSGEQIYATPLTTMAVDIAIRDVSTVDASSLKPL